MANSSSLFLEFPPELVEAVALDAAGDAENVGYFLHSLGLRATPEKPIQLPAEFLLELGAALRMLIWESEGIRLHLDAGLPSALDALRGILQTWTAAPGQKPTGNQAPLAYRVLVLFVENFAWTGRRDLDADILVGPAEEDEFLDVLAQLIWTHRAAGHPTRSPAPSEKG